MDLPQNEETNEAQFLIEKASESVSESPIAEQSSDLTLCDIRKETSKEERICQLHLLDKGYSIDEEILATPLEPVPVNYLISTYSSNLVKETYEEITSERKDTFEEGCELELTRDDSTSVENKAIEEDETKDDLLIIDPILNKISEIIVETPDNDEEENINCTNTILQETDAGELVVNGQGNVTDTNKESDVPLPNNTLPSILRRHSCLESNTESALSSTINKRKVSFPTNEDAMVTYREPDDEFPWIISKTMTAEKILQIYQNSCKKYKAVQLDILRTQIQEIKNNTNHSAILNLSSTKITTEVNETLEDLLKVTNFHTLILHECSFTPETMSEFLNMLEYYESVCHIEVSMNFDDDETWKCFCSACSNIKVLESISFKGTYIKEQYMRNLLNAVKNNPNITTLKFDGCMLVNVPNFYLVENLMTNTTIKELYLPSIGLYTKEADVLGRFLQRNFYLKVLDISNNSIGDRGLEVLAKGLAKQTIKGQGLSVLVMFNNQISEKSGPIFYHIISECKNLHTLNIGYNNLTDEVLTHISASLTSTRSLEGLGLQCTLLTCKGIDVLAQAIPNNKSLQKINLKGNKAIQINGVEKLCQALTNSIITKIEIDETNRSCNDPDQYMQLVKKMNEICKVNKNNSFVDANDEEVSTISQIRKVSLSCEPRYTIPDTTNIFQVGSPAVSPIPSPMSSPASKSRFQISKVQEVSSNHNVLSCPSPIASPSPRTKSRFRVTRVPQSPDEEISLGRFANVRSSVSSNDSMDSLATLHLDSDSE